MRPSSVATPSLLPFMVAGVLVLLALNLVHVAWEWWNNPADQIAVGNKAQNAQSIPAAARLVDVPIFGHNLQFGDANAPATLIIFTDPACAPCRLKVARALAKLPPHGVRIVYKFWPEKSDTPTGGLLTEIARREGLSTQFMRALEQHPTAQGDDLLGVLENAGLPLAKQQDWLKNHVGDLLDNLNQDISQGQTLTLSPAPQFILNNFLLTPGSLPVEQLPLYVERINAGEQILQPNDYWLNP